MDRIPEQTTTIGEVCQHEVWHSAHTAANCQIHHDTLAYSCYSDWSQAYTVTVVVQSGRTALRLCPRQAHEDDATLVSDVQAYLWCRTVGCPAPPPLERVWDSFVCRYELLMRRVFNACCQECAFAADFDEFRQEVWQQAIVALPNFRHDPIRGGVSAWLAGVARRRFWDLAKERAAAASRFRSLDDLESPVLSPHCGPEETVTNRETFDQLESALDHFCGQTPHQTYQVFFARVFSGLAFDHVAKLLGLSPGAARTRFYRAMKDWHQVGSRFLGSEPNQGPLWVSTIGAVPCRGFRKKYPEFL